MSNSRHLGSPFRRVAAVGLALLVVATACGAPDVTNEEPPAAYVFSEAEKQELGYDPDTEVYIQVSGYENYASLDEMIAGSDIVVRGVVDGWEQGRIVAGGEVDSEIIVVTVKVADVLVGDVEMGDIVSFPWTAWNLNPDGTRGKMLVTNGIRVPAVGQDLLLFLRDLPDDVERSLVVRPTHYLITLDGLLNVDGDRLYSALFDGSDGEGTPTVGIQLNQVSYEELKTMVDAASK